MKQTPKTVTTWTVALRLSADHPPGSPPAVAITTVGKANAQVTISGTLLIFEEMQLIAAFCADSWTRLNRSGGPQAGAAPPAAGPV